MENNSNEVFLFIHKVSRPARLGGPRWTPSQPTARPSFWFTGLPGFPSGSPVLLTFLLAHQNSWPSFWLTGLPDLPSGTPVFLTFFWCICSSKSCQALVLCFRLHQFHQCLKQNAYVNDLNSKTTSRTTFKGLNKDFEVLERPSDLGSLKAQGDHFMASLVSHTFEQLARIGTPPWLHPRSLGFCPGAIPSMPCDTRPAFAHGELY